MGRKFKNFEALLNLLQIFKSWRLRCLPPKVEGLQLTVNSRLNNLLPPSYGLG